MRDAKRLQRGVSLAELVISMVVVSIALSGTLSVMNFTTAHSADPMLEAQGLSVAQAYLEEILQRSFADPDDGLVCGAPEASRALYDDVCDYDGLTDVGPVDQSGSAVAGLDAYTVAVAVDSSANLNGLTGASDVMRVDVRVTHPVGLNLLISGYRTAY